MEKKAILQSKPQHCHQDVCFLSISDVGSLVWSRDLDSNIARHPKTENLPNEKLERHPGGHPLERATEHSDP